MEDGNAPHQYFGILVSTGFSTWATQKPPETSYKGRKSGNPATYVPFRGNLLTGLISGTTKL